ncbi:MAG TPA: HU family DNA-binding protein, partial [Polyangia bacterium]
GAYTGKNPRTGEPVAVKPKRLPFFKAGQEIKERLNLGDAKAAAADDDDEDDDENPQQEAR